jgi:hypothetical protein
MFAVHTRSVGVEKEIGILQNEMESAGKDEN